MSDTAFQTQYRAEHIAAFERRQSLLRETVTHEGIVKGRDFVFLIAGSGGATAVTRGVNGLIPARADDLNQVTLTLEEWHDLVKKTNFNVFASQGDQRRIMQETTMAVINRKIDDQIITVLNTATIDLNSGAAVPMTLQLVIWAKTVLANNNAGGANIYAAISPAAFGYLMMTEEFSNAQYVDVKPFANTNESIEARFRWAGVEWIVHNGLPGNGTSDETLFMWNKAAIGHGADVAGMKTPVGYDEEQDYSWARASMFMGAKKLQNSGIVKFHHDASALAAP